MPVLVIRAKTSKRRLRPPDSVPFSVNRRQIWEQDLVWESVVRAPQDDRDLNIRAQTIWQALA